MSACLDEPPTQEQIEKDRELARANVMGGTLEQHRERMEQEADWILNHTEGGAALVDDPGPYHPKLVPVSNCYRRLMREQSRRTASYDSITQPVVWLDDDPMLLPPPGWSGFWRWLWHYGRFRMRQAVRWMCLRAGGAHLATMKLPRVYFAVRVPPCDSETFSNRVERVVLTFDHLVHSSDIFGGCVLKGPFTKALRNGDTILSFWAYAHPHWRKMAGPLRASEPAAALNTNLRCEVFMGEGSVSSNLEWSYWLPPGQAITDAINRGLDVLP